MSANTPPSTAPHPCGNRCSGKGVRQNKSCESNCHPSGFIAPVAEPAGRVITLREANRPQTVYFSRSSVLYADEKIKGRYRLTNGGIGTRLPDLPLESPAENQEPTALQTRSTEEDGCGKKDHVGSCIRYNGTNDCKESSKSYNPYISAMDSVWTR